MPHVGIQRFATGDDEENAAEGEERLEWLGGEEVDDVHGVHRTEDARLLHDLRQAEHAEHAEPDDHDRSEHLADRSRAATL